MSYFDFHQHNFFKHFLPGAEKLNRVSLKKEVGACISLPELGFIITSQSAPFQAAIPNGILCSAIVPLERGFSKQNAIKNIAPKLTRLDRAFISAIADGRISYWNLLQTGGRLNYFGSVKNKVFPLCHFNRREKSRTKQRAFPFSNSCGLNLGRSNSGKLQ